MKFAFRLVIGLIIVGALAAGGYWLYQTRFAPQPAVTQAFTQVVPVRQGALSTSISVVGELAAEQSQNLSFDLLDGTTTLKTLDVAAGNTVKAGQMLATIDPAPYQQALDQAKSDLEAAEKTLADLKTPATQLALAQADLAIAQADFDLAQGQQNVADLKSPDLTELTRKVEDAQASLVQLDLQQQLAAHNALAKTIRDLQYTINWNERRIRGLEEQPRKNLEENQELDTRKQDLLGLQADLARAQSQQQLAAASRQAELSKDQAALKQAQADLALARAGGDALAVAKAELDVRTAQVARAKAQDARAQLDTGADPTQLATAQADVDKKQLAMDDAQKALDGTKLKAPFDGTVTATKFRVGDQITDTEVILTVANLQELQVFALVDETTIRRVQAGQTAEIGFDAFPGQTFRGTVLSVPLQGELQNDVLVYQVPLSLAGAGELPLLVGMTANVRIETAQVEDALLVPTLALQRVRGGYQVAVVNPDKPEAPPAMRDVEVGLSDGQYTQIVQGLQAGEQVQVTYQAAQGNGNLFFRGGFGAVPFGGGAIPGGGQPHGNESGSGGGGGGNQRP